MRVLNSGEIFRVKNVTIKSEKHELMTQEQNRVAFSAYCDKRFSLDPINSLPFGNKNIREFSFHNVKLNYWDWESETNKSETSRKRLGFNFTTNPGKCDI